MVEDKTQWENAFNLNATIIRAFVLRTITRLYLKNEMSEETVEFMRNSKILRKDKAFVKIFVNRQKWQPNLVNFNFIEPKGNKPEADKAKYNQR